MPLLEISFLAKFTHPEEEKTIPRYVNCLGQKKNMCVYGHPTYPNFC